MGYISTWCFLKDSIGGIIPSTSEISSALQDQLGLFERRLDGEVIDPSDMEGISSEDDAYYKTNQEYSDELQGFEDAMNGVD